MTRSTLALVLLACPFLAAEEFPQETQETPGNVHLYADVLDEGNIKHLIEEARRSEQAGEYDKAIAWYETGLARYGGSLFPTATPGLYRPLEAWVRERIAALPPPELARYRLKLDAEADVLLASAREKTDPAPAAMALERFGLSARGRAAAALLGELDLERGLAGTAARSWEAAVQDETLGGSPDPMDLARLALLRARQGRLKEAQDLADRLARMAPALTLAISDGEQIPAPDLAAWLGRSIPHTNRSHPDEWPALGGDMARNASCPSVLWVEPTPSYERPIKFPWAATPAQQQQILQQQMGVVSPRPILPCHGALGQGAFVFSRGDQMSYLDPETGKLFRAEVSGWPGGNSRIQPQVLQNMPPRALSATLAQGIAVASLLRPTPAAPPRRGWGGQMSGMLPRFGLVARDLANGKLKWYFPREEDEDFDIFDIRTAPVVCGDVLVAACTRITTSCEVSLVGLDVKTGSLLWRRFLCASPLQQNNMGLAITPEPGLSAEGSLVVCATQRGAVVAVDAETGRTRWAFRYDVSPVADAGKLGMRGMRGMRGMQGWNPLAMAAPWKPFSPPVLSGGTAFVLPADSDQILALDMASGRRLWQKPTESDQILGISRGRVVLTGGLKGVLFSCDLGAEAFRFSIPSGGACGRGLVTRDLLLIPTQTGIHTVDLGTGKLGEVLLTWPEGFVQEGLPAQPNQPAVPKMGGANLLLAGSRLFAVGASKILSYRISDAPEEFLLGAVKANPADPHPRLRLARHYRASGMGPKALETLRQAWKDMPGTQRSELSELLAALLRDAAQKAEDPKASAAILQEALTLPLQEDEEAAIRLDLGRILLRCGEKSSALDVFQDVLDRLGEASTTGGGNASLSASGQARQEIAALLKSEPDLAERSEERVRRSLKGQLDDPDRLAALASAFPESVEVDKALLSLGGRLLGSAPEKALRLMGACVLRRPGSAEALQALDAMADYALAQRNAAWRSALMKQLAEQMALGHAPDALRRRLQEKTAAAAPAADPWDGDPFPLEEGWLLTANERTGLLSRPGEDLTDWSGCLFLSSGMMVDAGTGKLVWQAAPPSAGAWMGIQYSGAGDATISSVRRGSQAERAGMKPGDHILSIDGRKAAGGDLKPLIQSFKPGQAVSVLVQREGKEVTLDLQLARAPAEYSGEKDASDTRFLWSAPSGSLLLAGSLRRIYAFDAASREKRWELKLCDAPPETEDAMGLGLRQLDETTWNETAGREAFVAFPGVCVVRDETGTLRGVDVEKGQILWQVSGETFGETLLRAGEKDVIALAADACLVISKSTGEIRLKIPTRGGLTAAPLVLEDRLVLSSRTRLSCISLADGRILWEKTAFPAGEGAGAPVPLRLTATDGRILATGEHDLAVLDAATGERAWHQVLSGMGIADFSVQDSVAYLGTTQAKGPAEGQGGDRILAYSLEKGTLLWQAALDAEASCRRPFRIGRLVAVDAGRDPSDPRGGTNAIRFLDAATGRRVGSLMLPWNRGRVRAIRRAGPLMILETSSGIYGYTPKGPN